MKTSDFDYNIPSELIAHEPAEKRDHSRFMVIDRRKKSFQHKHFYNIVDYLKPGDLLVLNDTRVMPANLTGVKEDGGAKISLLLGKELMMTGNHGEKIFICLVKPGKKLKPGSRVIFGKGKLAGKVLRKLESGEQIIEFNCRGDFWKTVRQLGDVPLPPYIKPQKALKQLSASDIRDRYQTVYAEEPGASAAPTAGLHFTPELLKKIKAKGINIAFLTLHAGLGTFRPVFSENLKEHKMHSEYFFIPQATITAVEKAKRVIAVGTTTVRALETLAARNIPHGPTDLFIYPGFKFKVVDAMITNFHWPKSTLIMLVSAFAGKSLIMRAYKEAVREKYRFFSFGDAMLIL